MTGDILATAQTQLAEAFEAFNDLSAQLAGSYRELEQRVTDLTRELSVARDGQLRELAEKQRLAARLEQIVAAMPAAVIVSDRDGIIRETNRNAADLLGSNLNGMRWETVAAERLRADSTDSADHLLEDGRRVSLGARDLDDGQGRIVVLHDVTETRVLQEQLHHQQRLTALGEMAASLAHQVRTPLASALLYVGQLARPALDDARRLTAADKIRGRLLRLEGLVRDMLAFARRDAGGHDEMTVELLFNDLNTALQPLLADAGAALATDDCSGGALLRGSRDALVGALTNIAVNALQAGATHLALRAEPAAPDELRITLRDDGPGMPAEVRAQAFEPFFSTRTDGTGLGLAVVRTVVQAHHGRVELTSAAGAGTTLTLTLPVASTTPLRSPQR